jgi:positive regulator of sigma E activity
LQYRDLVIAVTAFAGLMCGALVARRYFTSRSSAHLFTPVVLRKIIN